VTDPYNSICLAIPNGGNCMSSDQCSTGVSCVRGKCGALSNGAIVGIVIGSVALISLVIGGIVFKRKKNES
jgi:hypothetical protein